MDDWWETWLRARRGRPPYRSFFEDPEEFMQEFDRRIEEEFRWLSEKAPKELVRETVTKGGVKRKEFGPFVYGYSFTVGPDGVPIIREFGNVKPRLFASGKPSLELKAEREPVVDVMQDETQVRVIAELPGVKKEDIQLDIAEERMTMRVETEDRKYFKEVELPSAIETRSAKATYTNGVLEVILQKKRAELAKKGAPIKID